MGAQAGDTWISGSGFQKREQMPGDHAAGCRTSLGHVERVIRNAPVVTTLRGHCDHCPHEETQARKKSGPGARAVEPQSRDQRNPCVCKVQLGGGGRVSLVEAALAPQHHMTAIWLQARRQAPRDAVPVLSWSPKQARHLLFSTSSPSLSCRPEAAKAASHREGPPTGVGRPGHPQGTSWDKKA